jgi:hypothetical protein
MKGILRASGLLCLLLAFASAPVAAKGVGVRAGVSGDPSQFYFGVHTEMGPVARQLWFRPNLEVGVGNGVTTAAVNLEFAYNLNVRRSQWDPYIGGGPALVFYRDHGHANPQGGFNILLGVQNRSGFFTEFKVGLAGSPSVKFGVGYVFKE